MPQPNVAGSSQANQAVGDANAGAGAVSADAWSPPGEEVAPHPQYQRLQRSEIDCGTVLPSTFAVFRLTTNSDFVDCCAGKSVGLVLEDLVDEACRSTTNFVLGDSPRKLRPDGPWV